MLTLILLAIFVAMPLATIVLAISVWLTADDKENPFQQYGTTGMWLRCAGLVAVITAWRLIAIGILWASGSALMAFVVLVGFAVIWFGGLMLLFERSFDQAFMLTIANWAIGWAVDWGIEKLVTAIGGDGPV